MLRPLLSLTLLTSLALAAAPANADVFITEFNSNSGSGNFEFVEFTNVGASPVNMSSWSESDSDNDPGTHDLSAFGIMQPGQSAILTEATPDAFRSYWWGSVAAAPAGLIIIGPYTNENLSSGGDTIHLYDATTALRDILVYPNGGGTANGVTRNGPLAVLGTNQNAQWTNSFIGDTYGSFRAAQNQNLVGNPGIYTPVQVPEPATIAIALVGAAGSLSLTRRKRRA
jgi:hypothetical protein